MFTSNQTVSDVWVNLSGHRARALPKILMDTHCKTYLDKANNLDVFGYLLTLRYVFFNV